MALLIKNKLITDDLNALPSLLKSYHHILISSGVVSLKDYTKYFIENTMHFLEQNKSYLLKMGKGKISGMALLRFDDWDSNFFKIPVGYIEYILLDKDLNDNKADELEKELLISIINLAEKLKIKILYVSACSRRHSLLQNINSLGFNFICGELEGLSLKGDVSRLSPLKELNERYRFRKYNEGDYRRLIEIAKEISCDVESKFSLTPYFRKEEKSKYYIENIKNCCLGINADDIFVVLKNEIPVGFLCYRHDKRFKEALKRRFSFLVIGGILRSERRKSAATSFFNWAHKQVLRESEAIVGKVYLHNLPMMSFILGRRFMHSFDILYTFCKKL